jgi:hypothetical protein
MESTWTLVSILGSVASLALAVVAIWISLHMKDKADETNQRTHEMLTEIRSDAKSIVGYAMPELQKYGDSVREFAFQKDRSDPDAIPPKIEEALQQTKKTTEEQIKAIRSETDLKAVWARLDQLENQLATSQDNIRESVKESQPYLRIVQQDGTESAIHNDTDLARYLGSQRLYLWDYDGSWTFQDRATGNRVGSAWLGVPVAQLCHKFPEGLELKRMRPKPNA